MSELRPSKKFLHSDWKILVLALIFLIGTERQARAYTDPGTGAMIWQMLVAGFVGAVFYFRRFTTWFKNKGRKD